MSERQEKKKPLIKAAGKASGDQSAKGQAGPGKAAALERERAELGAMLRPEAAVDHDSTKAAVAGGKGSQDKGLKVAASSDKAEKEADAVADAIAAPKTKTEKNADGEEAEGAGPPAQTARGPPIRAGPSRELHSTRSPALGSLVSANMDQAPLVRRVADQNGGQPNTDTLAQVPAIAPTMAEVQVPATEEATLEELPDSDFAALGEGESAVMMKAEALPNAAHPDRLPHSLSHLVRNPGPGQVLPASVRQRMEACLPFDLGDIRVHLDQTAHLLTRYAGARAFACGRHIFLKTPSDLSNVWLMAHEATHCIQQGAARRRILPAAPSANTPRAPPAMAPQVSQAVQVQRLEQGEDAGFLARRAETVADNFGFYELIKVFSGKRLFTEEHVPQTAVSYCGAFMKFIGAEQTFEQMKQSGSLERGFAAIKDGAERHDITWNRVKRTFARAYDEFEWTSPIESLQRIFGAFFADVRSFGALILKTVAELVAEAFVIGFGPMGRAVWDKIKAIGENIGLIVADPLGFAMNLMRAAARGIEGFGSRILTHIKKGLLAWLLGPIAAMGVTLPEKFDLRGIISILLQVLGLTYPKLRERIVRKMNPRGELKVTLVEKLISFINTMRTEGLAGVWRKFLEYVDNLQMTVVNGIRDWVVSAVVQAGIRKLVAWSNPAGALIDILLTIYNLIVFFVQKFEQIVSFASSVFDSLGKIARGQLTDAARAIENTLALTIPIMISFLTRLLGLPDVAGSIKRIITNLREKVGRAVDRVLDFIIKKIKKLVARLIAKFKGKKGEPEQGITLQGTRHKLKWEKVGKERQLFLHSDKTRLTGALMQENADRMQQYCLQPYSEQSLPGLISVARVLRDQEAHETRQKAKSESHAASPQNNKKREEASKTVGDALEKSTDKKIAATEAVKSGNKDIDRQEPEAEVKKGENVPPDQKPSVESDMEDAQFRYVVVPEDHAIEGSWGTWNAMQQKRKDFKEAMKQDGLEGRYAVDLDHNPEYQILWRLGHLKFPDTHRLAGAAQNPARRMYPAVSAYYGNGDLKAGTTRNRASSDTDLVMAIRYDAHRKLSDTHADATKTFNDLAEYSDTAKAFVPKSRKKAAIMRTDWAALVNPLAEEHQAQLSEAYTRMERDNFVSPETLATIQRHGTDLLNKGIDVLSGNRITEPVGAEAEGHTSGIGMAPDPVDAELTTANYKDLKSIIDARAPNHGRVFDKHHLIEHSVLEVAQEDYSNVTLMPGLSTQGYRVAGVRLNGMDVYKKLYKNLTKRKKRSQNMSDFDVSGEVSRLLNANGVEGVRAFNDGNVKTGAFAITVLKVVNGLLGSQPTSHVAAATAAHVKDGLQARYDQMVERATAAYDDVDLDNETTRQDGEDAIRAATDQARRDVIDLATDGLEVELRVGLSKVLDQLTATAHADYRAKMANSMLQTQPRDGGFEEGTEAAEVYKNLLNRWNYESGDLGFVQQQNKSRWVA